jgi:hypothetical protein
MLQICQVKSPRDYRRLCVEKLQTIYPGESSFLSGVSLACCYRNGLYFAREVKSLRQNQYDLNSALLNGTKNGLNLPVIIELSGLLGQSHDHRFWWG